MLEASSVGGYGVISYVALERLCILGQVKFAASTIAMRQRRLVMRELSVSV